MGNQGDEDVMKDIVKLARSHFENGGRIVTAWISVTAAKKARWKSMRQLWKTLDDVCVGFGGENQVFVTASNFVKDDKIFVEVGSPEGAAQFYCSHAGVALAKLLYFVICQRAKKFSLPALERSPMRSSAGKRGSV